MSSLYCNGSNSFLFINTVKSKEKDAEIKPYSLCLSNNSKDFSIDNMKKTGPKGKAQVFLWIIMLLILAVF